MDSSYIEVSRTPASFINGLMKTSHYDGWEELTTLTLSLRTTENLSDLFELALLISFAHLLSKNDVQVTFDLSNLGDIRAKHLGSLGFPSFCRSLGILCNGDLPSQLQLPHQDFQSADEFLKDTYWYCLVPLTLKEFQPTHNEAEALRRANEILTELSETIASALDKLRVVKYSDVMFEVSHILFGILKELLLNSITHSCRDDEPAILGIALTLEREVCTDSHAHHAGTSFREAQDKFQVLVFDFGRGIMDTLTEDLGQPRSEHLEHYLSSRPFRIDRKTSNPNLVLLKERE